MDNDDDFDPDFDPTWPRLEVFTDAGHPFSIPWGRQPRAILSGFNSSRMTKEEGPWVPNSPFEMRPVVLTTVIPESDGGVTSYWEGMTTSAGSSTEHLSATLGLTVGYPFLNASVSGKFDEDVMKNNHVLKISRNSSCRMGRIVLFDTPEFSQPALHTLRYQGPSKFREIYGHYYVYGYELGANSGACLSAADSSEEVERRLEITVAVKVLFVSASAKAHTQTWSSSEYKASMSFISFSTLDEKQASFNYPAMSVEAQAELRKTSQISLSKVTSLFEEVRKQMAAMGFEDGKQVPFGASFTIIKSGLVVGLLLAPFARLEAFQRYSGEQLRVKK